MKLKTLAASIILASAAPLAMAEENVGPYIGGNFGFTSIDTANEQQAFVNDLVAMGFTSASMGMDQKSTEFKVFGGYQANENFAVEGYWANLGTYGFTLFTTGPTLSGSGEIKVTAMGVDLVGMLPFSPQVSGIVRVGYYQGKAKDNFSITDGISTESDSSTSTWSDAKFGFGAEWKFNPSVRLRTEWEYYNDSETPISVLSVGIVSHF